MSIAVEILTPERKVFTGQAFEVVAPAATGLMGVRPGHTPLLSTMLPGVVKVIGEGGVVAGSYFVAGGVIEVGPTKVRVLADSAQKTSDIDVPKAKEAIAVAEKELSQHGAGSPAYEVAYKKAAIERARLVAAA